MFFVKTNPMTAILLEWSGHSSDTTASQFVGSKGGQRRAWSWTLFSLLQLICFLIVYRDYSHENLLTGVKIFYQLPFLTTSLSSDHIIYKVSFCEILLNWMMLSSVAKQVI